MVTHYPHWEIEFLSYENILVLHEKNCMKYCNFDDQFLVIPSLLHCRSVTYSIERHDCGGDVNKFLLSPDRKLMKNNS